MRKSSCCLSEQSLAWVISAVFDYQISPALCKCFAILTEVLLSPDSLVFWVYKASDSAEPFCPQCVIYFLRAVLEAACCCYKKGSLFEELCGARGRSECLRTLGSDWQLNCNPPASLLMVPSQGCVRFK